MRKPKTWRSGPPSQSPGAEQLRQEYDVEQQSLAEIARRYGVSKTAVSRWLRAAGISTRSISEGTSLATKGKPKSEEHRKKLAVNAAKARAARTPEGFERGRLKKVGREPPNKGESWSDETRARHAYRQTDEYREAAAARQRGELGPNWQGGKTDITSLHGWPWRLRRQECYERDNWTCQDCGCKCLNTCDSKLHPKRKIQAHHLVARRHGGGDELENLVTLCMSCHHKRERADATGVTG